MKQRVYFVLAPFVTVDANTEEKGLFKGRKCLACGHQLQITILVFFFLLNLRPGSEMQLCVRIIGLKCAHTSEGGAELLKC